MRIAVIGFHPVSEDRTPEHVSKGRLIVERLAQSRRHTLAIWPQVPADLDWIARIGAEKCNDHRSAARDADLVLVAMHSLADLRAVLFGAGQAISELAKPGATILDMSCLPPEKTCFIPGELAARGKHYVAASLSASGLVSPLENEIRLRLDGTRGAIELVVPVLELVTTRLFTNA